MATEYERKRLENIRRNDKMMAALKVHAKASLLSAATKRLRVESKSFKKKNKTSKRETPIVIRKSLRTRGLNPDSDGLPDGFSDVPKRMAVIRKSLRTRGWNPDSDGLPDGFSDVPKHMAPPQHATLPARVLAPLPFDEAYGGEDSPTQLIETILGIARMSMANGEIGSVKEDNDESYIVHRHRNSRSSSRLSNVVVKKKETDCSSDYAKKEVKPEKIEFEGGFDMGSLSLEPHNVARVVPKRILVVKFLPCTDVKMIAAGDKLGNVGFWNLDSENEEDDGIYLFSPHTAPVSSIVFQQNSFSRIVSSSYDGLIRLMDIEKSVFNLVCSSDKAIFSCSQRPNDEQSLYFGEGYGMFNTWDLREGKSNFHWDLHEDRINSIDFNPQNPNVMATSSTDGTACLWDLRSMGAKKPKTLKTVNHARAVHSAYFSPSGVSLATTSVDDYIGILSGANYEDTSMICHNNYTNRWISSFRGVWGWDDSYIFVGNRLKKIDVISPKLMRTVMTLHDPLMSAIPCRIDCHPLNVGMLAGSTAGGQVYVWTTK